MERQKAPVPGTRTVVVRRPLVLLLTRSGPAPSEPVRPRLEAVSRTGPSLSDLRNPKLMGEPYALGGAVGYGTADVGRGWSSTLPVLVALPILARAAAGDEVARAEPGATQAQRDDVVSAGGSVSAVPAGPAVAGEHLDSYGAPVAAGSP